MQTLDFKIGFGRKKLADGEEQRVMRHHTWVAVAIGGSAVLGAGVSAYGANKQAKANESAQNQNAQLQRDQNNSAWQAYLMSRGINPMGATAGTIPTNAPAINARLPLYANVNVKRSPTGSRITGMARPTSSNWWSGGSASPGTGRSWSGLGITA
jgi:hypothetical protein